MGRACRKIGVERFDRFDHSRIGFEFLPIEEFALLRQSGILFACQKEVFPEERQNLFIAVIRRVEQGVGCQNPAERPQRPADFIEGAAG